MFFNISFLEPHWISMSKYLILSVFTNDFDCFTVPAVFHWANFVSVEFLYCYRHSFQRNMQGKSTFCLLITWRIGERLGHSWKNAFLGQVDLSLFITKIYPSFWQTWPPLCQAWSVLKSRAAQQCRAGRRAAWPPPLWQIHKELKVIRSKLEPVKCWT